MSKFYLLRLVASTALILQISSSVVTAYYNVTVKDAVTFNVTLYEFKNLTIQLETNEPSVPFALNFPRQFVAVRHTDGSFVNTSLSGTFQRGFSTATFIVEGVEVKIDAMFLKLYKDMAQWAAGNVSVLKPLPFVVKPPAQVFGVTALMIVFAAFAVNIFGFSLTLEVDQIVCFLKKPAELGVICVGKFILMPLIALMYGAIFQPYHYMRYVLLAMMAAPSGALTNVTCLLINGRLNLNVLSLIFLPMPAIFMTPFWVKFMGEWLLAYDFPQFEPEVPWGLFLALIFLFSIPGAIAVLLNKYFPKQSYIISVIVRPIAIAVVFICCCLTAYDNWWTMRYTLDYRVTLPPVLTLVTGAVIAAVVGYVVTRNRETSKTIVLQICIPNPGFALLFLLTVVPQPYGITSICVVAIYYFAIGGCIVIFLVVNEANEECRGEGRRRKNLRKMVEIVRNLIKPGDEVRGRASMSENALRLSSSSFSGENNEDEAVGPKVTVKDVGLQMDVLSQDELSDVFPPDAQSAKSSEARRMTRGQIMRKLSHQAMHRVVHSLDEIYTGAVAAEASRKRMSTSHMNIDLNGTVIRESTVESIREVNEEEEEAYYVLPAITITDQSQESDQNVIIDPIDMGKYDKPRPIRRASNVIISKVEELVHGVRTAKTGLLGRENLSFQDSAGSRVGECSSDSATNVDDAAEKSTEDTVGSSGGETA